MKGSKTLLTKLILTMAIIVTLVPLLVSYEVKEASASKTTLTTTTPITSASSKVAAGYGIGTLICPNRLAFNNEQINFDVSKSKGGGGVVGATEGVGPSTAGSWSIHPSNSYASDTNSGSIDNIIHLSSPSSSSSSSSPDHNILLKGIEQHDNICSKGGSSSLKTNNIIIAGECNVKGTTTILLTALDGKKGTLNGMILCDVMK
jgi:hypothetical protein